MNIFRARKIFVVFFDESFYTFRLKFERLFFINFSSHLNDDDSPFIFSWKRAEEAIRYFSRTIRYHILWSRKCLFIIGVILASAMPGDVSRCKLLTLCLLGEMITITFPRPAKRERWNDMARNFTLFNLPPAVCCPTTVIVGSKAMQILKKSIEVNSWFFFTQLILRFFESVFKSEMLK